MDYIKNIWAGVWNIFYGAPNDVYNSLIFQHYTTGLIFFWWFIGMQSNTQSEVSDERIDQHIDNIENTFDKFKISEPNQYNLCDDGGYSIKYGIV